MPMNLSNRTMGMEPGERVSYEGWWDMDDAFGYEEGHDEVHDQVGTVEVQILLSWFFETANPSEIAYELPEAA